MANVEIHRRLGEQQISAILELSKTIEKFDGHKALEDHIWLDLVQGGRKGVLGLIATTSSVRSLAGYAQISKGSGSWGVELLIHPQVRNSESPVAKELLQAALREISNQGGGHVHTWIAKPTQFTDQTCRESGMRQGRDIYQMRRHLPISPSLSGMEGLRTFRIGHDELDWLSINNRAFASHPEQGNWSLATLIEREAEPWFDPEGFLLYEIVDRMAAFCWTKIHSDEQPPIGEIYVIGTDPDLKGKGIGEKLCISGLKYLSSKGLQEAMLYVDADNVSALSMYKKLGFTIDHTDRAYVADITPNSHFAS